MHGGAESVRNWKCQNLIFEESMSETESVRNFLFVTFSSFDFSWGFQFLTLSCFPDANLSKSSMCTASKVLSPLSFNRLPGDRLIWGHFFIEPVPDYVDLCSYTGSGSYLGTLSKIWSSSFKWHVLRSVTHTHVLKLNKLLESLGP